MQYIHEEHYSPNVPTGISEEFRNAPQRKVVSLNYPPQFRKHQLKITLQPEEIHPQLILVSVK